MANSPVILDLLLQLQKSIEDLGNAYGPDTVDKLTKLVERVEEMQEKILFKMDEIEKTIYEPDEGLFSRIKTAETKHQEKIHNLDKDIAELQTNQQGSVHLGDKDYVELVKDVADLKKWKSSWTKIIWVVLIPSMGTGILKILFDFFSTHIQIK